MKKNVKRTMTLSERGRLGGLSRTKRKRMAARRNGKLGGCRTWKIHCVSQ